MEFRKALGPSNQEHPAPAPSSKGTFGGSHKRSFRPRAPSPSPQPKRNFWRKPQTQLSTKSTQPPAPQPQKELFELKGAVRDVGFYQFWSNKVSLVSCQGHFATLPIHVAPSFCARLLTAVSLGPPEGATTHHRIICVGQKSAMKFLYEC